ncbi:MAG TPA: hypothetical protein VN844_07810 [Pyrinomonadaceae bacterium]|nr:hypothetical protein [Pyrinomonadaceae bacterium]
MKNIVLASLVVLFAVAITPAQTRKDVCHVYVVDVELARKAAERFQATGDAPRDAKASGLTTFPQFNPTIGEEELTTKTYPFPGSRLIITASVYYTDESMASADGADSMQVAIAVAPTAQRDALSAEDNAVSEVTDNVHLDTVRLKKFLKLNGRLYLVGMECRCKERSKSPGGEKQ